MSEFPWKHLRIAFDPDRQIEDAFRELIHSKWGEAARSSWQPDIDVFESKDAYLIEVDLPGIAPAQLDITADEHHVTISGKRQSTEFGQSAQQIWLERRQGQFFRRIALKHAVDPTLMKHECVEGLHHIRLPKRQPPEQ